MKTFARFLIEATMSTNDALKVLGLKPNFTDDQLKTAYKKAAVANHPDKGGNIEKMQQINVARDLLSQPVTSNYDDYEDEEDNQYPPHPQSTDVRYMQIYEMFRAELRADIRSRIGDGEIRVPLMKNGRPVTHNEIPLAIIIQRQRNMLGTEYRVRGIFKVVPGKVLTPLIKLSNNNDDTVFWESRKSVMWFFGELKKLMAMNTLEPAQVAGKLQELLKYYKKNQTKIDPNVQ